VRNPGIGTGPSGEMSIPRLAQPGCCERGYSDPWTVGLHRQTTPVRNSSTPSFSLLSDYWFNHRSGCALVEKDAERHPYFLIVECEKQKACHVFNLLLSWPSALPLRARCGVQESADHPHPSARTVSSCSQSVGSGWTAGGQEQRWPRTAMIARKRLAYVQVNQGSCEI